MAPKSVPVSVKMEPPANWLATIENIRMVRQRFPAPVDTMGCDQAHTRTDKDVDQRFQVLVSLMLSSQTKDPITWKAVQKLKEKGMGKVEGILEAKEKDIEELIYPVGFYRRKAIYLKKVAKVLKDHYGGDVPNTVKGLCELPGVGPKMAHLCMLEAWDEVSGIGVDTHVHRISARLGWVPKVGIKNPEDTRKALESWLPHEYWREINHLLVGFGQTICTPTRPKCGECNNNLICPSSEILTKKSKKSKKQPDSNNNDSASAEVTRATKKLKTEKVKETRNELEFGDNEVENIIKLEPVDAELREELQIKKEVPDQEECQFKEGVKLNKKIKFKKELTIKKEENLVEPRRSTRNKKA